MLLKTIPIEPKIKFKIYNKHGINFKEVKQALHLENKFIKKSKDGKYIALTKYKRYLTIVFTVKKNIALIITVYPSSNWQINLFQRRIKK